MATEKPIVPPDTADVSAEPSADPLPNWRDTPSRRAIVDFVEAVTAPDGPHFIPPEERVAVFDNDGTLWCEKPLPIQFDFILRRLATMAEEKPELSERSPSSDTNRLLQGSVHRRRLFVASRALSSWPDARGITRFG